MSKWDIAKTALKYTSPVSWLIAEGVEKGVKSITEASNKGLSELEEEVAKQSLKMVVAQHQARVAQELAIAKRIENAEEVEIEEFYDTSGKGNIGVTLDQKNGTGSLGVGAEGRKVTKRIYHFKGSRVEDNDVVVQTMVKGV